MNQMADALLQPPRFSTRAIELADAPPMTTVFAGDAIDLDPGGLGSGAPDEEGERARHWDAMDRFIGSYKGDIRLPDHRPRRFFYR